MSYSFEARFSTTRLSPIILFERLDAVLPIRGLHFSGSITSLMRGSRGQPRMGKLGFRSIASIVDAADAATVWWGIGFECISDSLRKGIGRNDAIQVCFEVFRTPDNLWTLRFVEWNPATDYRIASNDGARDLYLLQAALCGACDFDYSIYEAEDCWTTTKPAPTMRNLEVAIKRRAAEPGYGDLSIVVSSKLIDLDRGRILAGPRAEEVEVSDENYVLFPFLAAKTQDR